MDKIEYLISTKEIWCLQVNMHTTYKIEDIYKMENLSNYNKLI